MLNNFDRRMMNSSDTPAATNGGRNAADTADADVLLKRYFDDHIMRQNERKRIRWRDTQYGLACRITPPR